MAFHLADTALKFAALCMYPSQFIWFLGCSDNCSLLSQSLCTDVVFAMLHHHVNSRWWRCIYKDGGRHQGPADRYEWGCLEISCDWVGCAVLWNGSREQLGSSAVGKTCPPKLVLWVANAVSVLSGTHWPGSGGVHCGLEEQKCWTAPALRQCSNGKAISPLLYISNLE